MVSGSCRCLFGFFMFSGFLGFGFADPALAQDHEAGHGALQIWNAEGRASVPLWIRIWLSIMQLAFATGLIFVWRRVEAR